MSNDLGLLSEEYHVPSRRLLGNFPQALTHIAVVNTGLGLCGPILQRGAAEPASHQRGTYMTRIAVITGAGAGVGRAVAEEFARNGWHLALLSRDKDRLEHAAESLIGRYGIRAIAVPTDVADADAVEAAADRAEAELGPIDAWVNVAMSTVFSPVSKLTAAEIKRGTEVTYLGQVHGMMTALARMRSATGAPSSTSAPRSPTVRCRCRRSIAAPRRPSAASPTACARRSSTTSWTCTSPWWTCRR